MVCVFAGLFFGFTNVAHATDAWEQISDKNGVVVSRQEMEETNLLAFRGEGTVDVEIERLISLVYDVKKDVDWVDLLEDDYVLRGDPQTESLMYYKYDLSWPVSDRDYVVTRNVSVDNANESVTVLYNSVED